MSNHQYVYSKEKAITFKVDKGRLVIIGVGTKVSGFLDNPPKTAAEMALEIVCNARSRIIEVAPSKLIPEVLYYVEKWKHMVNSIEMAVLNPRTTLGKNRLMREFELLINDM